MKEMADEREAFEAWASDSGTWLAAIKRSGDGYILTQTQQYWEAWQARAQLSGTTALDHGEDRLGMVEALEFYAENRHWYEGMAAFGSHIQLRDHGEKARDALSAYRQQKRADT